MNSPPIELVAGQHREPASSLLWLYARLVGLLLPGILAALLLAGWLGQQLPGLELVHAGAVRTLHLLDLDRPLETLAFPLSDTPVNFDWSPDGRRVAYLLLKDNRYDLYLLDIFSRQSWLIIPGLPANRIPSWSPDSQRFAFTAADLRMCIYTLPPDLSTQPLPLPPAQTTRCLSDAAAADPVWSPDGSQLAYFAMHAGRQQLFLTDPLGSTRRPLTDVPVQAQTLLWSPDGASLLFLVESREVRLRDIFVVEVATGKTRNVTLGRGYTYNVVWSPDSRQLAYHSVRGNRNDPYILTLDTLLPDATASGLEQSVTGDPEDEGSIGWSPDGRWLAYVDTTGGSGTSLNQHLWVMLRAASLTMPPLTLAETITFRLAWRPGR